MEKQATVRKQLVWFLFFKTKAGTKKNRIKCTLKRRKETGAVVVELFVNIATMVDVVKTQPRKLRVPTQDAYARAGGT
jgi:hypothetical protein